MRQKLEKILYRVDDKAEINAEAKAEIDAEAKAEIKEDPLQGI